MSATAQVQMKFADGVRVARKRDGRVGSVVQTEYEDVLRILWDDDGESVLMYAGDVKLVTAVESTPEPMSEPVASFVDPIPNFPAELKACNRWCAYGRGKQFEANGLPDKTPYDVRTGRKSNTVEGLTDFQTCVAALPDYHGLGYRPEPEDGLTMLDFDHCVDPTRHEIDPRVLKIVHETNSYAEISPSGAGVHIFTKGWQVPDKTGHKVGQAEIYSCGRYFTVTGNQIPGTPNTVEDRDLSRLYERILSGEFDPNKNTKSTPASLAAGEGPIPEGFRDNTLISIGGKLRAAGLTYDEIEAALLRINEERCKPPKSDEDIKRISKSACRYPVEDQQPTVLIGGMPAGQAPAQPQPRKSAVSTLEPESEGYEHTLSAEEHEAELNREWPVIPLKSQPGPEWSDDILYGLSGDIIRKASAYNEAHPAGMLLDLLVSLGSIFGHNPYFNINSTVHHTNEFLARVGDSAYSRKGGGRDEIDRLLRQVDAEWYKKRTISGFGSAEAIIDQLRDSTEQSRFDTKTGTYKTVMVPGVSDKRLCIREGELASVFVLAGKADSRADIVMRDGWDCKPLKNVVKGKTKDGISLSAGCEEPHLSISGDTTRHELVRKMPDGADENGFGNRFLYVYVYRIKLCPLGGPEIDWSDEIVRLYDVVQFAQEQHCVGLTASAKTTYARMYSYLENNHLPGLAGKMTSRAAPHIRRLALIYALIDKSPVVDVKHLRAAQALWNYCEDSAQYIFAGTTKSQLALLRWMGKKQQPVSSVNVREDFYSRNKKAQDVKAIMESLLQIGRVQQIGDTYKLIGA